jgi:DNA topoisomerase-1
MREFYDDFHPTVDKVKDTAERASGERLLGTDPDSGRQVIVRLGRFGPMAQIGSPDDEETPRYAGLLPHQSITSITFEEALDLFKLPRALGEYNGESLRGKYWTIRSIRKVWKEIRLHESGGQCLRNHP